MTDATQGRPGLAEHGASAPATTLREEHAVLRREVTSRAQAVLSEADQGRWPQLQLQELLNYLRLEVLQQVVDEEWLLFRAAHHAPDELARLRRDHLELRLAIDVLAQAAAADSGERLSPWQLSATTRDLLAQLEQHFAAEEELSSIGAAAPATASLGAQPHEWYSLIQAPVIDLDQLAGEQGVDAVLGRLLRLAQSEQVEIRSSGDPSPLWRRLVAADPGGYGLEYLERDPSRWRVAITRRPEHWTPHPLA
jgi:uncharacterized protein (DUF2249 family)